MFSIGPRELKSSVLVLVGICWYLLACVGMRGHLWASVGICWYLLVSVGTDSCQLDTILTRNYQKSSKSSM